MNKGFTLLELLASIVILSTIILIAVPTINNVADTIKRNHYKNMVKNIEVAASKYAFDTKEEVTYVDTLIKEGYLSSDREDDLIVNPENQEIINCYIVTMNKVSDYYEAKLTKENYPLEDNNCDLTKLEEKTKEIKLVLKKGEEVISDNNVWLKGDNITLEAISDNLNIDCGNNKCLWSSSSGITSTTSKIDITSNSELINSLYNFQITYENEEGIKRYKESINIKVDNEKPTIKLEDTKKTITDPYQGTLTKSIKIVANDGRGSGILSYYLGYNESSCANVTNWYDNNKFTISNNGNYLICVKDKVGNIASESILIDNIETSNNDEN